MVDIWTAASTGEIGLLQQHIEAGTDLDQPNPLTGSTPLGMAIFRGHAAAARVLVESGADIEAKNADGATPLITAAFFGHEDIVRMLIHAGADLDARNRMGFSALQSVDSEWSDEIEGVYKFFERITQVDLDLEAIRAARPGIAEVLRVAAGE